RKLGRLPSRPRRASPLRRLAQPRDRDDGASPGRLPPAPGSGEERVGTHRQVLPGGPDPGGRLLPREGRRRGPARPGEYAALAVLPCLAARAGVRPDHDLAADCSRPVVVSVPVPAGGAAEESGGRAPRAEARPPFAALFKQGGRAALARRA